MLGKKIPFGGFEDCQKVSIGIPPLGYQYPAILSQIGFFMLIMVLFPLVLGPNPDQLNQIGIAINWIAAFVSIVPAYERLFSDDYTHGFIEKALHNNFSPESLDDLNLVTEDMNADIHASADYRASLVVSAAQKAVAHCK